METDTPDSPRIMPNMWAVIRNGPMSSIY